MNNVKRSAAVLAVAVLSGLGAVAVTASGSGTGHPVHAAHALSVAGSGTTAYPADTNPSPSNEDWG